MDSQGQSPGRVVKVAVIGSGLAGLTAAHLLSSPDLSGDIKFDCHVFEKEQSLGLDANSISLPYPRTDGLFKGEWRIDVPMRSFQGGYYRELIALYKELGIKFRQADFSYSFSRIGRDRKIATEMIYNGATGRSGLGVPSTVFKKINGCKPTTWRTVLRAAHIGIVFIIQCLIMLYFFLRLAVYSSPLLRPSGRFSYEDWVILRTPRSAVSRLLGLDTSWRRFSEDVLIPTFSAVCTAPVADVLAHPVEELLEYCWLTLFTHHYVASEGVRAVAKRLSSGIHHIHYASPVISLCPRGDTVTLFCGTEANMTEHNGFTHVILATQANAAARILLSCPTDSSPGSSDLSSLRNCLEQFSYRQTVVTNHTDKSLLPSHTADWRDLNLVLPTAVEFHSDESDLKASADCVPPTYTMATHIIPPPPLCHSSFPGVLQTTNPFISPYHSTVLSSARLERAIVTAQSKEALKSLSINPSPWWDVSGSTTSSLGHLQGTRLGSCRIWICGSYASRGIPLLEGCVRSARDVVEKGIFARERV